MIYGNVFADGRTANSLFEAEDKVHRHNPTYVPRLLRTALAGRGLEINTPDVNIGRPISFDLHIEGREFSPDNIPKYLIALENPYINRLNADRDYCSRFAKVFTWNTSALNLPNLVKVMVPNLLSFDPFPRYSDRDIFSCLINANKAFRVALPNDLYRERINTIRWYEACAPDKFQLYGMGWEKPTPAFDFRGRAKRSISSLRAKLFGHKPFPSYRGEVNDKRAVMRRSKFAYCYENTQGPDNYITEKIFDSFLGGCVPVYWGARNILEYIPANCFIAREAFKNTGAVHDFLLSIQPEEYAKYQANIVDFLRSNSAAIFSAEYFVSVVSSEIVLDVLKRVGYPENVQ